MGIIYLLLLLIIGFMIVVVFVVVVFPTLFLAHVTYTCYKKKYTIRAILCASIGIGYVLFMLDVLLPRSAREIASDYLDFSFSYSTRILECTDDYFYLPIPGGMSDGYLYIVLQLSATQHQQFWKHLQQDATWHSLPLPPEFITSSGLFEAGGDDRTYHIPLYAQDGAYKFVDYQALANKKKQRKRYDIERPFYQRHSWNFMLAIYDNTTYRLYLYELNT